MSLFQFGFRPVAVPEHETDNRTREPANTSFPTLQESGLGIVEYDAVTQSLETPPQEEGPPAKKRRGSSGNYTTYKAATRAKIGKYALENGNERARKHFLKEFPNLAEGTVRYFKKLYQQELERRRKRTDPQPVIMIPAQSKGRPTFLLDLDQKLLHFLKALRVKGGAVNIHVVRSVAKALIESNPSSSRHLQHFTFPRTWVQSVYRRMGYTRRASTTGRPPVPQGLYDECRKEFLQNIANKIEEYQIPSQLIMNSDQTPSSYVSVGNSTMSKKGSQSVPIKGVSDKRAITLNFVITLSNAFLLMQIIYTGKTKSSQPRQFKFPSGFLVSQNPQHWSNEVEVIQLIEKVINPYVVATRMKLNLAMDQKALLIWDVFKAQKTTKVIDKLKDLNIEYVYVPANMTHFFQLLDLTVNRCAKQHMRNEFVKYYSESVKEQLDSGKELEEVETDLRLSVLKPLHAQWLVNLYNYLTSPDGAKVISRGWKKAEITGLLDGTTVLPPEDPFYLL